ncbi:MAG: hypothetical protein MK008_11875 [Bdellovibrionales bacterium]|nr:hypothetical protein [Bdellovibrionales bacterium]
MKYIFAICLILSFLITACNSGSSGSSSKSPFQGIWFDDEIVEFKQSKDSKIICSNIENSEWTNYKNELMIDGFRIDSQGNVSDFNLNHENNNVMFKVRDDGTTFDNAFLKKDENCENCEKLIGFTIKKVGNDKLINIVKLKTENSEIVESRIEYVRMSEEEVSEIKTIFNNCKLFNQDIYDKCMASGVKAEKCQEISFK